MSEESSILRELQDFADHEDVGETELLEAYLRRKNGVGTGPTLAFADMESARLSFDVILDKVRRRSRRSSNINVRKEGASAALAGAAQNVIQFIRRSSLARSTVATSSPARTANPTQIATESTRTPSGKEIVAEKKNSQRKLFTEFESTVSDFAPPICSTPMISKSAQKQKPQNENHKQPQAPPTATPTTNTVDIAIDGMTFLPPCEENSPPHVPIKVEIKTEVIDADEAADGNEACGENNSSKSIGEVEQMLPEMFDGEIKVEESPLAETSASQQVEVNEIDVVTTPESPETVAVPDNPEDNLRIMDIFSDVDEDEEPAEQQQSIQKQQQQQTDQPANVSHNSKSNNNNNTNNNNNNSNSSSSMPLRLVQSRRNSENNSRTRIRHCRSSGRAHPYNLCLNQRKKSPTPISLPLNKAPNMPINGEQYAAELKAISTLSNYEVLDLRKRLSLVENLPKNRRQAKQLEAELENEIRKRNLHDPREVDVECNDAAAIAAKTETSRSTTTTKTTTRTTAVTQREQIEILENISIVPIDKTITTTTPIDKSITKSSSTTKTTVTLEKEKKGQIETINAPMTENEVEVVETLIDDHSFDQVSFVPPSQKQSLANTRKKSKGKRQTEIPEVLHNYLNASKQVRNRSGGSSRRKRLLYTEDRLDPEVDANDTSRKSYSTRRQSTIESAESSRFELLPPPTEFADDGNFSTTSTASNRGSTSNVPSTLIRASISNRASTSNAATVMNRPSFSNATFLTPTTRTASSADDESEDVFKKPLPPKRVKRAKPRATETKKTVEIENAPEESNCSLRRSKRTIAPPASLVFFRNLHANALKKPDPGSRNTTNRKRNGSQRNTSAASTSTGGRIYSMLGDTYSSNISTASTRNQTSNVPAFEAIAELPEIDEHIATDEVPGVPSTSQGKSKRTKTRAKTKSRAKQKVVKTSNAKTKSKSSLPSESLSPSSSSSPIDAAVSAVVRNKHRAQEMQCKKVKVRLNRLKDTNRPTRKQSTISDEAVGDAVAVVEEAETENHAGECAMPLNAMDVAADRLACNGIEAPHDGSGDAAQTVENAVANVASNIEANHRDFLTWLTAGTRNGEAIYPDVPLFREMHCSSADMIIFSMIDGVEYAFYDTSDTHCRLGYLRFKARQCKERKRAKKFELHLIVLTAKFDIATDNDFYSFKVGDMVTIKKGSSYTIKNVTDEIGVLMVVKL